MSSLFSEILSQVIAPVLMLVVGWLVGKRKSNAEAVASELTNVEKALEIYRGIIAELRLEVKGLQAQVSELEKLVKNPCTCQKLQL